jgi:hypothetical protein
MRGGALILAIVLVCSGCQTDSVQQHTAALTLSGDSLAHRQMQSRRFDTRDERMLLSAAAGLLQDLGFSLEESSLSTGLLVASKNRWALDENQAFLAALVAAFGGQREAVWDRDQKIRVSLVTTPVRDAPATVARVTFQRAIYNSQGVVSRAETINDVTIYREFFDKLSKSVFLEAHEI